MKRWLPLISSLLIVACGGGNGSTVSERAATTDECAAGGTVLQVDGKDAATVCNGVDGKNGATGAQGPQGAKGDVGDTGATGARGPAGTNAGSSDIIEGTLLCQSNDATTGVFLSAYIWVLDPAADPNNNIGQCYIEESTPVVHDETEPLIGTTCNLPSSTYNGVVNLDFSVNPPTVTGAATGTMSCTPAAG